MDPIPTLDELFPTKGAIPEALQIGRADAIADLTGWFLEGSDVLTIQPRRIGKSSTIGNGALVHVREQFDGVIGECDLRQGAVTDARGLADALLISAQTSGAGRALRTEARTRLLSRTRRYLNSSRARAAAEVTGDSSTLRTAQAWATLIVGDGPTGIEALRTVLSALEEEAGDLEKPVVVFIDEIQDLADPARWSLTDGLAVQQEIARAMGVPGRLVTYAFAGSEETAMEKVFAHGMPLYFEGERYVLPPIDDEAWRESLPERFARDGRDISAENVDRITGADGSHGHPLRTMQICRAALRIARRQKLTEITSAMIDDAIAQAKSHPSWNGI